MGNAIPPQAGGSELYKQAEQASEHFWPPGPCRLPSVTDYSYGIKVPPQLLWSHTVSITAGESKRGHCYQHEPTLRSPSHSSTPPNYHKLTSSSRVMEVTCPPQCPWKVSASFDEEPRATLLRTIVLTARVQCLAEIY